MPANLPAEARAKWLKVMDSKTPEEKLRAMEEFLSTVPKHKGTEKLVMQVRRQMAILRREIEARRRRKKHRGESFFVEKEGDVQVVLLGGPNSGKTLLFNRLTGLNVKSSEVPMETRKPVPGIVRWSGIYLQLVDSPSLIPEANQGELSSSKVLALARNADAVMLVIDACYNPLDQAKILEKELENARITIRAERAKVRVERRRDGGIVLKGSLAGATLNDLTKLLKSYGIYHALVEVRGKATLDEVEESLFTGYIYKPAIVMLTKLDMCGSKEVVGRLREYFGDVPVLTHHRLHDTAPLTGDIVTFLMRSLGLIRVYTRNPRTGMVEERPLVMRKGARVIDVAKAIHSRLYKNFRYSKVWSSRLKFSPQKVGKDFELEDGDVVEIVA